MTNVIFLCISILLILMSLFSSFRFIVTKGNGWLVLTMLFLGLGISSICAAGGLLK